MPANCCYSLLLLLLVSYLFCHLFLINCLIFVLVQSTTKVKELQDQLNITLTKTHRKVNSLKSQFTEHKKKWESVSEFNFSSTVQEALTKLSEELLTKTT